MVCIGGWFASFYRAACVFARVEGLAAVGVGAGLRIGCDEARSRMSCVVERDERERDGEVSKEKISEGRREGNTAALTAGS